MRKNHLPIFAFIKFQESRVISYGSSTTTQLLVSTEYRHSRPRIINCVVTNGCRSKRGVWQTYRQSISSQNTDLQAYYLMLQPWHISNLSYI